MQIVYETNLFAFDGSIVSRFVVSYVVADRV